MELSVFSLSLSLSLSLVKIIACSMPSVVSSPEPVSVRFFFFFFLLRSYVERDERSEHLEFSGRVIEIADRDCLARLEDRGSRRVKR